MLVLDQQYFRSLDQVQVFENTGFQSNCISIKKIFRKYVLFADALKDSLTIVLFITVFPTESKIMRNIEAHEITNLEFSGNDCSN